MATAVGSLMIRRMLSLGREYQLLVGTAGDGRNSGLVDDTEDDTEDVETKEKQQHASSLTRFGRKLVQLWYVFAFHSLRDFLTYENISCSMSPPSNLVRHNVKLARTIYVNIISLYHRWMNIVCEVQLARHSKIYSKVHIIECFWFNIIQPDIYMPLYFIFYFIWMLYTYHKSFIWIRAYAYSGKPTKGEKNDNFEQIGGTFYIFHWINIYYDAQNILKLYDINISVYMSQKMPLEIQLWGK